MTGYGSYGRNYGYAGGGRMRFDPAARDFIDRHATPPDDARAARINDRISALVDVGLWPKLEVVYFFDAADDVDGLLNWRSDDHNATKIGSPTFTADRGFAGNGSSTGLDTNWNPSASSLFLLNSASIGAWLNGGATTGTDTAYCSGVNAGGNGVFLGPRNASDGIQGRVNQASSVGYVGFTSTTRLGFAALSRTSSTSTQAYKNDDAGTVSGTGSSARPNGNIYLGGLNTSGSLSNAVDNRFGAWFAGAGLVEAEMLAAYNIIHDGLAANGAE